MNESNILIQADTKLIEKTDQAQQKEVTKISPKNFCVIITNKKNSSWVDDLDAHEKLISYNRIFH